MNEPQEVHGRELGKRLRAIAANPSVVNQTPRFLASVCAEAAVRVDNLNPSMVIAMEWGFKAAERGLNLEAAMAQFKELLSDA